MGIEVVPYTPDRVEAVAAFNRRLAQGGSPWGWYEQSEDAWLPRRPGGKVWREHYLAVEDGSQVRAAYALKPQEWWLRGEPVVVTDWQGPVSEGVISRRYNTLALRMMRDMLNRRPLLYAWGHGEDEAGLARLLRAMRWSFVPTPFCLKILRPQRFLRRNAYLRGSPQSRLALDVLAFTGLGGLGLKALDAARSIGRHRPRGVEIRVVERFGPWADDLWERCRGHYAVLGLRDRATLNALMPEGGWPAAIRLRVARAGADLGWVAVLDNRLEGDRRFGDLRVGTVMDALAAPEDAADVVAVASRFLAERGVDLLCSNQSHPRWIDAFASSGYLVLQGRRQLVLSPELRRRLEPLDEARRGLYLTNLDGHGPHGF